MSESSQGFRVRRLCLKTTKWANKNTNKPKQEQKISGRDSLAEANRKTKDVINSLKVEFKEHKMHLRTRVRTHTFLTALPPAVFLFLGKFCACSYRLLLAARSEKGRPLSHTFSQNLGLIITDSTWRLAYPLMVCTTHICYWFHSLRA